MQELRWKAYGEEYVAEAASNRSRRMTGKNIQDAHEAIRPSDVTRVRQKSKNLLQETSSVCIS